MAQAQIEYFKRILNKNKNISNKILVDEINIKLNNSKYFKLYYSKAFKDHVLSFNINSAKSFIITKDMWKIFRQKILEIDNILNN